MAEDAEAALTLLMLMSTATDPALRRRVQALVPRLVLDRAQNGPRGRSGSGRLRPVRADRGMDLDLDRSMDAVTSARAEQRPLGLEDLTAHRWERPSTALCLLVDRSGSMEGAHLATAAMAAAACALRAVESGGELSVVAFDRRASVIVDRRSSVAPRAAVERVLGLRGHGMTSLHRALLAAGRQLEGARSRRRTTILLSDCRVTDDLDPIPAARALDELLVIAPAGDDEEARRFAAAVGCRVATLESFTRLPLVLDRLMAV